MSAPLASLERRERLDPFAVPAPGRVPPRPRLLSFAGRWGRARRWLAADSIRVLDVGCASGYGSAAIAARGPAGRSVIGVEPDRELLAAARARFPWLQVLGADASELPFPDGCADALLLLDVIEHVEAPERVLGEAARVLRPGGTLIVTVPHKGLSRRLDALNVYESLRRRRPDLPPHEEGLLATEDGVHRHFGCDELEGMLGAAQLTVERVARTGVGLQELVHLAMLALNVRGAQRISRLLAPLHLMAYILDDMVPTGPCAYHLAVRARKDAGASQTGGTSNEEADPTAPETAGSAERT